MAHTVAVSASRRLLPVALVLASIAPGLAASAQKPPKAEPEYRYSGRWLDNAVGPVDYEATVRLSGNQFTGTATVRSRPELGTLSFAGTLWDTYVEGSVRTQDQRELARFTGDLSGSTLRAQYAMVGGGSSGTLSWNVGSRGAPPTSLRAHPVATATLPMLPSPRDKYYDKNGCTHDTNGNIFECPRPRDPNEPYTPPWFPLGLRGFNGPFFATALRGGSVVVLDPTVTIRAQGFWQSMGLVRNETVDLVTDVTVTAVLTLKKGARRRISAAVPVKYLRSGEPAPFVLAARGIDPADVVGRTWSVSFKRADRALARFRDTEIREGNFSLAAGYRDAIDTGEYRDVGPPPYPAVLLGDVTNLGSTEIMAPRLVATWFDAQHRVVRVQDTYLIAPPIGPKGRLPAAGAMSYQVVRVDADPISPDEPLTYAFWETP